MAATLVVSNPTGGDSAGIATIGGKFKTQKFSVTRYYGDYQSGDPLYPSYTFAHEIGHNLGASHNREQYENNGQDITYTFSYAFGYLIEGVQRTIMSYRSEPSGNETRIPHFTHPEITYNGYPTGISTSNENSAFVARAFENNRHVAAGSQTFSFEQIRYESALFDGAECGLFRGMGTRNGSQSTVSMESQNYVRPDGSVVSYSLQGTELQPTASLYRGWCRPESEANPLGTSYTESFYRYYHPITGELIEGPRFKWSETYIPQSELRIAYSDGGATIGNTVRMIPVGYEEGVVFEPDDGFSISEIKSTCEGVTTGIGGIIFGTEEPCRIEASFSADPTPPAKPFITDIQAGNGVAIISVSVPDDGGADITAISANCTAGSTTYSGESVISPVSVAGMLNGLSYTCSASASNSEGIGPSSDPASVTLPQTMPTTPSIARTDYSDGSVIIVVDVSSQPTTVDSYTAICTDGTSTYTSTSSSSPITVSGLTNDVAYTCTVTATNSVGTSAVSSTTDPITPQEGSTGLPIWLLYEASK